MAQCLFKDVVDHVCFHYTQAAEWVMSGAISKALQSFVLLQCQAVLLLYTGQEYLLLPLYFLEREKVLLEISNKVRGGGLRRGLDAH